MAQETMDETHVDVVKQSVPDEDPGDEIVHASGKTLLLLDQSKSL